MKRRYWVYIDPKDEGDEWEITADNKKQARKKAEKMLKKEGMDKEYFISEIEEIEE